MQQRNACLQEDLELYRFLDIASIVELHAHEFVLETCYSLKLAKTCRFYMSIRSKQEHVDSEGSLDKLVPDVWRVGRYWFAARDWNSRWLIHGSSGFESLALRMVRWGLYAPCRFESDPICLETRCTTNVNALVILVLAVRCANSGKSMDSVLVGKKARSIPTM